MQPKLKPEDGNIVRPGGFTQPSNAMDVPRTGVAKKKKQKRILIIAGSVLALVLVTLGLSRLKPAVPSIERSTVWLDTVKRGPMVRQVRGLGTLVPEEIRWIAARTEARVDRIVVRPGAQVEPETVLLELTSPEVEQAARDAASQYTAAEAELTTLRASLQREFLEQKANAARVHSEFQQAKMENETNDTLSKNGLVSALVHKTSKIKAEDLAVRDEIEQQRLQFAEQNITPQIAAKQAAVDQAKANALLKKEQMEGLKVRAGFSGVLQQLPLEVGQQVKPGTNLARVADPTKLKAEIKIAETQAKDIQINQKATVDTRNGVVAGHVIRVDPAVEQGTVRVDVALDGELPKGARPDLSVDGTIELERLDDAVFVGRPAFGQEHNTASIFKLLPGSNEAVRTQVKLGRSSVNTIEILSGLEPGDQVILSDTSAMDAHDRIRLN